MDDEILAYLRRKLREMSEQRAQHLAGGSCADWSEYKRICGVIEGLALAEREILELAERLKRAEQ